MSEVINENGSLSINSDNIFPIIKKWLYSDHDIFIRELVSNGCDAITKLQKLALIGEVDFADEKFFITVKPDTEKKTLTFTDNGIGMTADEIKKYINQIAFSGAAEFLEKYKDKANTDQIIGHFGLGFYSAFMVADKVTIDTLSYQEGAEPVLWESEGGVEYSMSRGTRTERGTTITLYMSEDSYEFSNEYRVKEVLDKYCSFMPVEIYLGEPQFTSDDFESDEVIDVDVDENGEAKDADKKDSKEDKKKDAPKPVNETHPLWNKHPNECTEEQYKDFYRDVFHDYKEPLFWIHLNMDYPFNLKGILYFPKINT
ncbi:MAG: molecular chaperone HtpG, partial [Lachnospiraceae bacterium]|nr:molecular chaperone HtpG [Lachnospiraceae bacterium]